MDRFRLGHASSAGWEQCVDACLDQIGALPPEANIGFLYVTDPLEGDLPNIVDLLRARTGVEHWVGTVGYGICCSGREYYETPAMTVMAGDLPADGFRVFDGLNDGLAQFSEQLGPWYREHQTHFAVVHGDPRNHRIPELIGELAAELPAGYLVGGITSSNNAYLQVADRISSGGLSGVVFNEQVPVITALTQGCTPIGPKHIVTECERNIITRIDDRPALEVFNEDIGELLARDLNRVAGYIFAGLPIKGSDTGDYLVRNLVGIDPQHQLIAIGDMVESGAQIMFCRRDGTTALEDMQRMLDRLMHRTHKPARAALYFSCLGRGRNLFGDDSEELRILRHRLGDVPLVGFYANGEISNNRLYGYTGVLSLFL